MNLGLHSDRIQSLWRFVVEQLPRCHCWSLRCQVNSLSIRRFVGENDGIFLKRAKPEQVKVTLGEYSLNSEIEPLAPVQVGVSEIFVHPYFKFTPQADRYDVAVLRLDRYVPYEPHISPICLPEKGDDFLGEYAWAAGWGAMTPGPVLFQNTLNLILGSHTPAKTLYHAHGFLARWSLTRVFANRFDVLQRIINSLTATDGRSADNS